MARILLIDDEAMVRYALSRFLTSSGHEVVEAVDGADPVVAKSLGNVDAVVTDVIMPNREGMGILLQCKERHPGLPVFVISGGGRIGRAEYLETAQALGADAVFAKPFDERDLLAAIEGALAGPPS